MRTDILERKNEILEWIRQNKTKAFISKQLNCKQETLNSYLKKMNIEYKGNQGSKGQKCAPNYINAIEYAQKNNVSSYILKQKLIRDGIKEYKCELCGKTEWMGSPIPLELHHKDGNHYNNDLNNIQILCPNCHSLQPGNSGANTKHVSKNTKQYKKKQNYCIVCGKEISNRANYCVDCYSIAQRRQQRPSRNVLKELIRTTSFLQIGLQFNVSDTTIRKWCKDMNLPYKSTEIKKYNDQEWSLI